MAAVSHDTYQKTRHFGSLDGLRFICIGAVLWHHSAARLVTGEGKSLLSRGFTGVDFFFVISGFLITTLLLRERARTGRISLRGFYWRRILRIIPIYFLVVTAVCCYFVLAKGRTDLLDVVPFYYLFLSNYLTTHVPNLSITWSLSVEEQYYVLWPLLLVLVRPRWILPLLAVLIALNLAAITGALRPLGIVPITFGPAVFKMFNATFTPILLGSAAAVMLHRKASFDVLARLLGGRWAPLPLFVLVLALLYLLPGDLRGWPNLLVHLAMTATLISIIIREDHIARPVLQFAPIARIGQISYGIYLYHMIALFIVQKAGIMAPWSQSVTYCLVSIAMAELSFRTFEAYFMSLRHKRSESVGALD